MTTSADKFKRTSAAGAPGRGMMLVWFIIILAALMALISLSVDLGRVQLGLGE